MRAATNDSATEITDNVSKDKHTEWVLYTKVSLSTKSIIWYITLGMIALWLFISFVLLCFQRKVLDGTLIQMMSISDKLSDNLLKNSCLPRDFRQELIEMAPPGSNSEEYLTRSKVYLKSILHPGNIPPNEKQHLTFDIHPPDRIPLNVTWANTC